jgi:hypothetical protein
LPVQPCLQGIENVNDVLVFVNANRGWSRDSDGGIARYGCLNCWVIQVEH